MSKTAHPRAASPTRWALVNAKGWYWTGWVFTASHTRARTWPRRMDVLAYIRGWSFVNWFVNCRAVKLP